MPEVGRLTFPIGISIGNVIKLKNIICKIEREKLIFLQFLFTKQKDHITQPPIDIILKEKLRRQPNKEKER